MNILPNTRPDPDALLDRIKKEEEKEKRGKLKIFLGMCAGVGKTYDMLKAAHLAKSKRIDVVIGIVETHGRSETELLLEGLSIIPRKKMEYRDVKLEEMDLDEILKRKPQLVLVDELAHTNAPGSRHSKRYQDVMELLDNGIDVYTTLNVQHLESRADTVARITRIIVRETVPDSIFEAADEAEIVDISPEELVKRLSEGKVYTPDRSKKAMENFFRIGNLTALREMSLRMVAERVDHQLRDYMRTERITGPWKSGQRLLVGISESPLSAKLIRSARRMAYTMDASWIALYVETSRTLSEMEKDQLAKNIKLARELGAEIISTADEDIVDALLRVAREQNASQILVGKSGGRKYLRTKNPLERLMEKSGELDIYIVGGEGSTVADEKKSPEFEIHSSFLQYMIAAGIIALVSLICFPLNPIIGYQTVALILLLTISFLPLKLGRGPLLLAATLSALIWNFFFIPPQFTFAINKPADILMFVTYFIIAIISGFLSARNRAQEKAVRIREERATALYSLTKDLSLARNQDEVIQAAVSNIIKFFDIDVVVYLGESDGDLLSTSHPASSIKVGEKEFGVASWVYWNEKKAGRFTDTLPFAETTFFPLSGPRYSLGVIGVKMKQNKPLSLDQEILLGNFISQISSTIERELLNDLAKKSIVVAESERLYKNLFNSISHELRIPISAIISASENLLDTKTSPSPGVKTELAVEIHKAAERLNRLVQNLLDMTRLESNLIQPKLDWCDLTDLINTALKELEKEILNHRMEIDISPELPLVKIDFGLLEQAITNLIHNASIYTPPGSEIQIRAFREGEDCLITVSDQGPGFPRDEVKRVFEKFYRIPGTKTGGIGLGLSIARGFVEAHRGTITVENREGNGARFIIRLPMQWVNSPVLEKET